MSKNSLLTKHKIRVLLIDDQAIIGESVKRMLSTEHDIEFHFCQDPTQSIKMANEISPTVILQDLVMPELDGLTMVRYIRANEKTKLVPLIVLSSKEEAQIKAKAFALGANDYMVKLPDAVEIIARIRYHSRGYINLMERNEAMGQLEKANQFIKKTFGQYLSDDIVESILETPEGTVLGGEKRVVTIMMTDLRGFTAIGERLPAEDVVSIINIYLETMTELILKYNGTIDEFIGDAIFVIFGAPIARPDDAKRAVACAMEMQIAMERVNNLCQEKGLPQVHQGIGINTGDLIVGNIGSTKRMKYGCVGRNVNLTARIESYTVGGQTFISESTKDVCSDILRIDDYMEVMPKGVKNPLTIYEIGGIGGDFNIYLPEKEAHELKELSEPISIQFTVLAGKHASLDLIDGKITKLFENLGEISCDVMLEKLTNLKISLLDVKNNTVINDLYGKITNKVREKPPTMIVNFTSLTPEATSFFGKILNRD